ncbi:MAG: hypothetical protein JNJ46_22860 [Myxococcales bacterium]|nr:hypothetical protein [Myxococcales bacterium]
MGDSSHDPADTATKRPFPDSLCHRCAAPPRLVTSGRGSVFILCPLLPSKYPPQPVRSCPLFRPNIPPEMK